VAHRFAISGLTAILASLIGGCAVNDRLAVQSDCYPTLESVCGLGSAVLVNRRAPFYPPQAASSGIEGWVDLDLQVDADGNILDVTVIDSDPVGVFEESAVAAAESWRFAPRLEAGEYSLSPRVVFDLMD
jgi:TonB family protein